MLENRKNIKFIDLILIYLFPNTIVYIYSMPRNRYFKHCVVDDSYSKNIMALVTRDQQKSIVNYVYMN